MTAVLVVLETRDGKVRPASLEALGAARQAADASGGGAVIALATEKAALDPAVLGAAGADEALATSAEAHSADGAAATAARVAKEKQVGAVFLAATIRGRDLAGRIAALLESGFAPDCVAVEASGDGFVFTRPVFAGKLRAKVKVHGPVAVASLRPNFFAPAGRTASATVGETAAEAGKGAVTGSASGSKDRPDVAEANRIVSGGRGMGGADNWKILEELADAIPGSALGASRAVVDAGWRPHAEQVGQTGKTVAPELYIAAGISGAIQHLAGMNTSKVIVAINKDSDAPIFQHATYGIVGDVNEVLPALTQAIRNGQS